MYLLISLLIAMYVNKLILLSINVVICNFMKFLNEKQINLYLLDKGKKKVLLYIMNIKEYWECMYNHDI